MSNRLLSLLVLVLIFSGLYGLYYYFFVASTASVSLTIDGSGTTSVTLTSEFKNDYSQECTKSCVFNDIPAVSYTLSAKQEGYVPVEKSLKLSRGERKEMTLTMEKEVTLTEQTRKKEETIAAIKLSKDVQEVLESHTGWINLGYHGNGLHYALPNDTGWIIFLKKEGEDARELFKIPEGVLTKESLDVYEGYIVLERRGETSFYSLANGEETGLNLPWAVLGVKDTLDNDTKIVTSESGVSMYTVSEKTSRLNPLYDDIIALPSGEIVALVKKSSKDKQSLLSLSDTANDFVFLIGQDTRERKTLLKTPKNGKMLRYRNGEILFVDEKWELFVVGNVK